MMERRTDTIVLGAGPAGMAAACAARACGLDVDVVDEQAAPGGQLFRNVENPVAQPLFDRKELRQGQELVQRFQASGAVYHAGTIAWGLRERSLSCTSAEGSFTLAGQSVIVATGGMERPVPFPGWTLPGVMSAGAADIILRSGGSLPQGPVVLAGNGPLLLMLACHLLASGVKVAAWLDTGHWAQRAVGAAMLPASVLDAAYMGKGMGMAWKIVRGKIPLVACVGKLEALGDGALERVAYEARGRRHELAATSLLRHEGIIPRTHVLASLGAEHRWDSVQRCWQPLTNENGATSLSMIHMAGDGSGVLGGDASILKGTLAGIDVARRLGVITEGEARFRSAPARRTLRAMRVARGFLRHMFAPNPSIFAVPDNTLVCRCECVSAGDIRAAVAEGYKDINEIKRFTRCGMGPCQGRMCGSALAEIAAAAQGCAPDRVGRLAIQQPLRPVTLAAYCHVHAPASK